MGTATGLTTDEINGLFGETIVDVDISGDHLILRTHSGYEIDVGYIRGETPSVSSATNVPNDLISGSTTTNVQTTIADLASKTGPVDSVKIDKTEVLKFLGGKVRHYCDPDPDRPKTAVLRSDNFHGYIFPDKFFAEPPMVLISPTIPPIPGYLAAGYGAHSISTRHFTINAMSGINSDTKKPEPCYFYWVAVGL